MAFNLDLHSKANNKAEMKKTIILLIALIIITCRSYAQITVNIPEITLQTPGSDVSVPINVTNFNGIGAITLKIKL